MIPRTRALWTACLCAAVSLSLPAAEPQTIPIHDLKAAPTLDGDGAEWAELPAERIALHNTVKESRIAVKSAELKAGVFGDSVYLLVTWEDPTEDLLHKPFVWNEKDGEYHQGPQREDRLALEFRMEGEYDTNWFSGKAFKSDMWHWKAGRTNPVGKADDQMTIVSRDKLLRAYQGAADDGQPVYIQRPWDEGDQLYNTLRYGEKQEEIMPKYVLNPPRGKGSTMDIEARGAWRDGRWMVELRRKLDTGQADDVKFVRGQSTPGGVAVFDHSENEDHAISETLKFAF